MRASVWPVGSSHACLISTKFNIIVVVFLCGSTHLLSPVVIILSKEYSLGSNRKRARPQNFMRKRDSSRPDICVGFYFRDIFRNLGIEVRYHLETLSNDRYTASIDLVQQFDNREDSPGRCQLYLLFISTVSALDPSTIISCLDLFNGLPVCFCFQTCISIDYCPHNSQSALLRPLPHCAVLLLRANLEHTS